mgnify:FL=1
MSDGVDISQVDGISTGTILTLLAETGIDLSSFPTSDHFVSWLCLCPNNKVTGGKVFSGSTRKNKGPLAYAFRQAANAAGNQKDTAMSAFFHRIAYRKGRKVAIVATARKIAVTVYNMLQKRQAWQPQPMEEYEKKIRTQKIKNIQRTISQMGVKAEELAFA